MTKVLSDYHYRESKEDWEKRIFRERDKQVAKEDGADEEYHRKKEDTVVIPSITYKCHQASG